MPTAKYKKGDYVAFCRDRPVPERYTSFYHCVFQIDDCIKEEENYNYVLIIIEGALNEEVNKIRIVVPEIYLVLLNKVQIEPDIEILRKLGLIKKTKTKTEGNIYE